MMTYIKENPIKLTIVVGLLGMVLYLFITADPPGYCGEQKRFLSDAEFIEIAVRYEVNTKRMNIDGSDASIRMFHANYPNCCRVDRRDKRNIFNKMLIIYTVVVQVIYEVNDREFKETKEKYYENNFLIDACGSEVLRSFGTGLDTIPDQ